MILTDLTIEYNDDNDDEDEAYLIFYFNEGSIAFECPIGLTAAETISAFRKFLDTAEEFIDSNMTVH